MKPFTGKGSDPSPLESRYLSGGGQPTQAQ